MKKSEPILINRAPVLTLWGEVVAERMGFDRPAALTLGKALAGLNAQAKGRMLGIYKAKPARSAGEAANGPRGEEFWVEICGRPLPAKRTDDGVRAVIGEKPIDPDSVERYLEEKFGERLEDARTAMRALAKASDKETLAAEAYSLYEKFRPRIPSGTKGWGAKGTLDLDLIRSLVAER